MVSKIIKEVAIILLLALAIIVVAGILLYNYAPTNKVVPEKISYTTPENVKEEINSKTEEETTQVVMTYKIDATDLRNYQKINDYVAGKKNPFASIPEKTDNSTNSEANNNSNQSGNNSNTVDGGGYLPDKGTK